MKFVKSSYLVPVIFLLIALLALAYRSDFSVVDMIAARAVQQMEGKYSPYGPHGLQKP